MLGAKWVLWLLAGLDDDMEPKLFRRRRTIRANKVWPLANKKKSFLEMIQRIKGGLSK